MVGSPRRAASPGRASAGCASSSADRSCRPARRAPPPWPRPAARGRSSGSPTIHAAPTSTSAGVRAWPRVRSTRARHSMECSFRRSFWLSGLIAEHGNEQVGDAGRAYLAEGGELLTIDAVEQQDAAAEYLPLVNRPKRPRRGDVLGVHHHLAVARLEFLHAALEDDAAAVDEHDVGQHVLDLLHLV